MANAVYAPGLNAPPTQAGVTTFRPGSGPGGLFAQFLQGATPKYAINDGRKREDLYRNTLARMFIRVDEAEMNLFLNSIGDSHTRQQLARSIAGDPIRELPSRGTTSTSRSQQQRRESARTVHTNGYLDFFIAQVQHTLQEKMSVSETLADNYVAFFFGQTAPLWNYSGYLINSVQDDQASNMMRLYMHLLRGTQLARRQKSISLKYDSYIVNGSMCNIQMTHQAANELLVPFSFQLLVKRIFITNFTQGWTPLTADTPFSADLNAIAFDGRPREENAILRTTARIPAENQETPGLGGDADPRTRTAPNVSITETSGPPILTSGLNRSVAPTASVYSSQPETVAPNRSIAPTSSQ